MLKRWMMGWLAIWLIASTNPIQAQSQGSTSSSSGSDPVQVITLPAPTPVIDLADWFPTRPGLIWEYSGSPLKTARKISMVGIERSLPPLTYLWEGFIGAQRIRKTDDGKILEIIGEGERLLFDLAAEQGASWTINALEEAGNILDGSTVTVISRTEGLVVPFGEFEQTLHLGIKPNPQLADAGVVDMWFAPGFGLVKWSEITFAGPQTYELVAQSGTSITPTPEPGDSTIVIEPIPIPFPDPIRPIEAFQNLAQIERDGLRYQIGTLQKSYSQIDLIEMTYRVTAITQEPTFEFGSTQQYDFKLVDAAGNTAWTWSANKDFGEALTSFTLKIDDSNSFFARMRLDNEVIPEGTYTLVGWMPTATWATNTILAENTEISIPVQITGQPTKSLLTGTTKDEAGNPVAATISLTQSTTSILVDNGPATTAIAAWSARGGTFDFRGMTPGTYTLIARAEGYKLHAQQIDLAAGLNNLDIILQQHENSTYTNIHEMVKDTFVAELATNKQQYALGDSVYIRYRLINIGSQDLTLTFPSGQQYDLHLDGSQGRVWTWSQDKSFILALSNQTLAAGATYEFETAFILQESWSKNDPSFLLRAHLAVSSTDGGQVTSDQTEAIVKFDIDGWVAPAPERPGPLSASLNVVREQYTANDTVSITYQLTNTSSDPITLSFNSGQRYDLVLNGPQGAIWGWSWTRSFIAAIGELTLAPGEVFAFEEQVALSQIPNLADGVYVLRSYMTTTDELADATEAKLRFWLGDTPAPVLPPTEPALPTTGESGGDQKNTADFDASGRVDFTDFLSFAAAFGTRTGMTNYSTDFDLDSDGQIAFSDFLTFASAYGK